MTSDQLCAEQIKNLLDKYKEPEKAKMTNSTPLSTAAQAVLDAANNAYWLWDQMCPADADVIAAAALRAAAHQVIEEYETTPGGSKVWPCEPVPSIRRRLLAIAAELEGGK